MTSIRTFTFGLGLTLSMAIAHDGHAQSKYTAGAYQIDPAHSKLGFEIPHLVISSVEGRFTTFDGTLTLADKFVNSTVKATAKVASIDTGNQQRDDHLRSPDFFDVSKFPLMSFESTSITGTPQAFKLNGMLTIKGVSKPVVFEGKYLGSALDAYGNQKAAFSAKTTINRKDFGLTWSQVVEAGPVVGDEVTLDLKIQSGRPTAKPDVKTGQKS